MFAKHPVGGSYDCRRDGYCSRNRVPGRSEENAAHLGKALGNEGVLVG